MRITIILLTLTLLYSVATARPYASATQPYAYTIQPYTPTPQGQNPTLTRFSHLEDNSCKNYTTHSEYTLPVTSVSDIPNQPASTNFKKIRKKYLRYAD